MIEIKGNVFDLLYEDDVDSICITTNGVTNYNGLAIMGAGVAGEAARRWASVRATLGKALKTYGNVPYVIGILDKNKNFQIPSNKAIKEKDYKCLIWSFPTKDDFRHDAVPELIERSAQILLEYVNKLDLKKIIIPLPGCSNGKLNYKKDVRPILSNILDDRFSICDLESDKLD